MFKGILGILLMAFIFVALVMAILFHKTLRNLRTILENQALARAQRKAEEEKEYFRRTSQKYYKPEEKKFDNDYFKSADEGKPKQKPQQKPEQKTTTRRTVDMSSGVTVIDDRDTTQQSNRKIFDDGEGEYIEFEEIKD